MRAGTGRRGGALLVVVPVLVAAGALRPEPPLPGAAPIVLAAAVVAVPRALLELTAPPATSPSSAPVTPPVAEAAALRRPDRADRSAGAGRDRDTSEQRGRAALRALAYDPAELGYRVVFTGPRSRELGSTNRRTRTITVHVRPGQSERVLRTTIAHELGHALDFARGTAERREAYRDLRGLPAGRWFPCDRCPDFSSPAGDFAEVFAVWLAGPGDFRSRMAPPPDADQLRRLAPLFALVEEPAPPAEAAPSPRPTPRPDDGLPVDLPPPPRHVR